MKVAVTGAAGMLGSHVVKQFADAGYEIVPVTRQEVDLTNAVETLRFFNELSVDGVVHCAARVGGIQANIEGGSSFLLDNLAIDNAVIDAARETNVQNFLYIGSSCVYPANRQEALEVDDILTGPIEPTNANYGLAKIVGAKKVEAISSTTGRNWRTFVASNLYGPNDHFNSNKSHLVASVISKVLKAKEEGAKQIEMWGDGLPLREFTYVEDFAKWISNQFPRLQHFPPIMNVGYGKDFSVQAYYEMVLDVCGYNAEIRADISKPSGNSRKLMDSSVARQFGWVPETEIKAGLAKTVEWVLSRNEMRSR